MLSHSLTFLTLLAASHAAYLDPRQATATSASTSGVPQYFQTTPDLYPGTESSCVFWKTVLMKYRTNRYWTGSLPRPDQSCAFWYLQILRRQHPS